MNSRFALPGGVTLKPPNGGVSFCKPSSDDLRNSGFRVDARKMFRPAGRRHRKRDLRRQAREQLLLARGGIAGFEGVVVFGHHPLGIQNRKNRAQRAMLSKVASAAAT
jgi:hypothetical protein